METFLGLLLLVLFVLLIVGLVNPTLVLKWSKKPTRLKVVGWYFLLTIIVSIVFGIFMDSNGVDSMTKINSAAKKIENKEFESAIKELEKIDSSDSLFVEAQILISKADSLINVREEESKLSKEKLERRKQEEAELLAKKRAEEKEFELKEQIEREINSINKGVNFATYRGSIETMQIELVLFSTWASIIKEGESSDNSEIKNLASTLKSKLISIQNKEFPILRAEYSKLAAKTLWEHDIDVKVTGAGNRYINFTGGLFATNKNKQDVQNQLSEILTMFRFSQSRYRWYEGEDTYTYYTTFEGKDSDFVTFEN